MNCLVRVIGGLAIVAPLIAAGREVAITIDDLPGHGCEWTSLESLTRRLLEPIRAQKVPITAFVIAGHCMELPIERRRAVLEMWTAAGAELGNHTYSHPDLNSTAIADYENDILRADAVLRETMGVPRLRWFRSPMLHLGADVETKARLEAFLAKHGWRQAPVTFDNSDWMFAYAYRDARERGDAAFAEKVRAAYLPYLESVIAFFEARSVEVVGREFPQVLLLHANELNAEMLPDLLAMLRRRGYRFVSLDAALGDRAYSLPDEYVGRGGFSWIHRWSITKKMPNKGEPDEPVWLRERYEQIEKQGPR
ncbi:MAG: polysaccharide deacetylase family protein [Bryobacteraceae bacterium]|jgi:peptidoglycan/xylan/chitin deacetylase (PgdA/CDA1 family)